MRRTLLLGGLATLVMACGDPGPTDLFRPGGPSDVISDGGQNEGNDAFFWLAPIVKNNAYTGVFNGRLAPLVAICELDLSAHPVDCAADTPPLATWTMASGLAVSTDDEHYGVEWHTDLTATDFEATYRIQVLLSETGQELLGFADVQFFSNGKELKNINGEEYVELRDGRTLPIRFRIEQGVSCGGQSDCGEAVVGPEGGTVTTESGFAGVELPEGAVEGDILIRIRRIDPSSQAWGRCLPTGLRQEEGCYEFDTEPAIEVVNSGSPTFHEPVVVGVCIDPAALRTEKLLLHKYDPEHPAVGVTELAGAPEQFLTCDGFAYQEPSGFFGRLAAAARGVLRPVASLMVRELYARDEGRGGVTDAFSFIGWAEPIELSVSEVPVAVLPATAVPAVVRALTSHNHGAPAMDASGHVLRFSYADPIGAEAALAPDTTDASGLAAPAWTLTEEIGVHTATVSTRMEIEVDGVPFLIPDPTPLLAVAVGGYESAEACEGEDDCGQAVVDEDGETVLTETGFAGVDVPAGALDGPILITVKRIDPDDQAWGDCLPTGLRQEEGCYEFDTEPALGEVNEQDAFNSDVVVAVCLVPTAVRDDRLTLHKYDPENPAGGVVELPGAIGAFLTCDDFASLPNGLFGHLARAGRRLLGPRPLYASDEGRGGVTDAFSFVGWAEPVTLSMDTEPNDLDAAITDVVVTAETAHNHGSPAVPADGATIRFEYTSPSGAVTVSDLVATLEDGAAESRISLTTQGGVHNVKASTQQEILIDSDLIISGGASGHGIFAAANISFAGEPTLFLVPDPTAEAESGDLTVLGLVSRWDADDGANRFADRVGPNHGDARGVVDASVPGVDGNGFFFDGSGGEMVAPATHIGAADRFTVAAWVKLDPAGSPWDIQRFVSVSGINGEKAVLRQEASVIGAERQGHFYGAFGPDDGTGSSMVHIREPDGLLEGCWQHVAGTYDGERIAYYRDGVLVSTQAVPLEDRDGSVVAEHVAFSSALATGEFPEALHGTLDEVEVHNHALSVAEIQELASRFLPGCDVATGSAAGLVLDEAGALPLAGASVVVVSTGQSAVTDARGRFRLVNVPAGAQTIRASFVGYEPQEQVVTIIAGETARPVFNLAEEVGTPIARLTLESDDGDFVGQGGTFDITYTPDNSDFFFANIRKALDAFGSEPTLLSFSLGTVASGSANTFASLMFGTDQLGAPISPGVYTNAQRADFAELGHPGLDISFQNRGCNTVAGSFTIHEVTFSVGSARSDRTQIETFSATFEQHCEGAEPALRGAFTYDAHGGMQSTALTAAPTLR